MKLAFSGKGGVGKTTIVTLWARVLKDRGYPAVLIDADPDMNLVTVLGLKTDTPIIPISELKELIAERTGVEVGKAASFFKLNPKVDDIPENYCINYQGMKVLVMGTVKRGGGGCTCPENAFLKNLLNYLFISMDEWILLDMEAGIEHLGRGTAIGVDHMVVIVEPNITSLETAHRIKKLSKDIGIKSLFVIGNKIQSQDEVNFLKESLEDVKILGFLDYSDSIKQVSLQRLSPFDLKGKPLVQMEKIVDGLIQSPVSKPLV